MCTAKKYVQRLREAGLLFVSLILLFSYSEKSLFRLAQNFKKDKKGLPIVSQSKAIVPKSTLLFFHSKPNLLPVTLPGRAPKQKPQPERKEAITIQITRDEQKIDLLDVHTSNWYEHYYFPSENDEYSVVS